MIKKFLYRGLPVSVLLILAAFMQGFVVHAFAAEPCALECRGRP